jgi:hypothetical protein
MAEPRPVVPSLLVVAVFGRRPEALACAESRLHEMFGPIALASPTYQFNQTSYYEPSMGPELRKRLSAFAGLVDPGCLADLKLRTNALEGELATAFAEPRPVNIDPGLLSLGKFVLATTKDQAHRIYLRDGVFAEVTLRYQDKAFTPWPWTYADYRLPLVVEFLGAARRFYRGLLQTTEPPS